jgi:hypothetical protein
MGGLEVFGFKVGKIREDVGLGGFATEEFQEEFDGIAQATDARFAVADIRRAGDAAKQWIRDHVGRLREDGAVGKQKGGSGRVTIRL